MKSASIFEQSAQPRYVTVCWKLQSSTWDPYFSLIMYPFSISTDEHVHLKHWFSKWAQSPFGDDFEGQAGR